MVKPITFRVFMFACGLFPDGHMKCISGKRAPSHKVFAATRNKRHRTYEGSHGWSKNGATPDHKRHPCSNEHGHVACQPPKRIRQVLLRETDLIYAHVLTKKKNKNKTQHLHLLYTTVIMQRASRAACQGFVWAFFSPSFTGCVSQQQQQQHFFFYVPCKCRSHWAACLTCVDDLMDDLCDVAFKERVEEFD